MAAHHGAVGAGQDQDNFQLHFFHVACIKKIYGYINTKFSLKLSRNRCTKSMCVGKHHAFEQFLLYGLFFQVNHPCTLYIMKMCIMKISPGEVPRLRWISRDRVSMPLLLPPEYPAGLGYSLI